MYILFVFQNTTQNAKRHLNEPTRTADHAREWVMNLFITHTKTPDPTPCLLQEITCMIIHVDIPINGLSVCIFWFCVSFLIFRSWMFSYCNFIPGIFWNDWSSYTHLPFIWTTKSKEV